MVKKSFQKEEATMKKQSNKKSNPSNSSLPETAVPDSALSERIAQKAYELYEKRGWAHGHDTEDWLEAERLVLAETKTENKARTKTQTKAESNPKNKTAVKERMLATKSRSVPGRL
jgi:hypothetical protein